MIEENDMIFSSPVKKLREEGAVEFVVVVIPPFGSRRVTPVGRRVPGWAVNASGPPNYSKAFTSRCSNLIRREAAGQSKDTDDMSKRERHE